MLRDRTLRHLVTVHREQGEEVWISFESIAPDLDVPIADVMYEAGALCEQKLAEKSGGRGKDLVRVTQKGLCCFDESLGTDRAEE